MSVLATGQKPHLIFIDGKWIPKNAFKSSVSLLKKILKKVNYRSLKLSKDIYTVNGCVDLLIELERQVSLCYWSHTVGFESYIVGSFQSILFSYINDVKNHIPTLYVDTIKLFNTLKDGLNYYLSVLDGI